MSNINQLNPITIPFRKIICKSCNKAGNSESGFKIYSSDVKDRVLAICESCGATNLIKKEKYNF